MKIGVVSTSLHAKTGYGRVCREIERKLSSKHEFIHIDAELPVMVYGGRDYYDLGDGVKILVTTCPNPLINPSGATSILKNYFGRYGLDIFISHWDQWAIGEVLRNTGKPYIPYAPVDSNLNRKWADFFRGALHIVAYSRFGYEELLRFFAPSMVSLIPHGVNTAVFKPLKKDKAELRRRVEAYPPIPEDCFLFVNTAANYGCRKLLYNLLLVFKRVAEKCPNAHLYLHTAPYTRRGYDLPMIVEELGIKDMVHFPPTNILYPITDDKFAEIYSSADVYVSLSCAEGFGLGLIESASCGVPIMAPANSAQKELVEGAGGWLIESVPTDVFACCPSYVPTNQINPVPNMKDAVEKMVYACENPAECRERGKKARKFALRFDWDKYIIPQWVDLLEEVEEELALLKEVGR